MVELGSSNSELLHRNVPSCSKIDSDGKVINELCEILVCLLLVQMNMLVIEDSKPISVFLARPFVPKHSSAMLAFSVDVHCFMFAADLESILPNVE